VRQSDDVSSSNLLLAWFPLWPIRGISRLRVASNCWSLTCAIAPSPAS